MATPCPTGPPYELLLLAFDPGSRRVVRLALEAAGARYADVTRLPKSAGGGCRGAASDRRILFNTQGIFCHYPELDA